MACLKPDERGELERILKDQGVQSAGETPSRVQILDSLYLNGLLDMDLLQDGSTGYEITECGKRALETGEYNFNDRARIARTESFANRTEHFCKVDHLMKLKGLVLIMLQDLADRIGSTQCT